MNLHARCNLSNETQADMTVHLKVSHFLAMTYGGNLRLGKCGEDPHVELRTLPEKVLIQSEMPGHKLWLNLSHGRTDPKQDMDGWGFNHNECDNYTGPLRADVFLVVAEGIKAITYHKTETGRWDEVLVPFVEDLLFFEGNYYGDYSVDNDGQVAHG